MDILNGGNQFKKDTYYVVTSGTFDGVHIGHQKILSRIRDIAQSHNGESVLITFWPHPRMVLMPEDHGIKLLSTFEEKKELIRELGIDHILRVEFTKEFSQLTSEQFIQQILIDKIGTNKLVIGYDHRFGKNREGGFAYLKENSRKYGFEVEEILRQDIDHVGVSSTKIRNALSQGAVDEAKSFLGRAYTLSGEVIKGDQLGRTIGFPTANIEVPEKYKLIPADGIYAVRVKVDEIIYDGMLNIGFRPTVGGLGRRIETYIFNFEGNLYGNKITLLFEHLIRREMKFDGLEELKVQLKEDEKTARQLLSPST